MTSTISSNKKVFKKLYKWAMARNRSVMIVFSILMILGIIIDLYIITQIQDSYIFSGTTKDDECGAVGFASIIIAQGGAMFFTFISALHTFAFLHNKRSTDMFGAIPATRKELYYSHLLGGITSVTAPFLLGSFVVMGFTCRSMLYFRYDLELILFGLVSVAAAYAFTALICYCCGTAIDSAIITFGANAIYSGIVSLYWGMAASMIPGVTFEYIFASPIVTLLSPYAFPYFMDLYSGEGETTALLTTLVWAVIYAAVMIFLGSRAAASRRAETAQNEFNMKWLPVVIKVGMSVVCGSFFGIIAGSIASSGYSNMFTFAFWYVLTGFAAFFILHIIFSRGFKGRFVPSLIAYICTTAAALALVFGMTTGMGIDTYVPSASNVKSVTLNYNLDVFKEQENIETITEIHSLIAEGLNEQYEKPYYLGSASSIGSSYYESYPMDYDGSYDYSYDSFAGQYPLVSGTDFRFEYKKKIGFSTLREYSIYASNMKYYDCDKIEQLLKKLYSSDEYKKIAHKELWNEDGAKRYGKLPTRVTLSYLACMPDEYSGSMSSYDTIGSVDIRNDEEFVNGLIEALKKDVLADKDFYKTVRPFYVDNDSMSIGSSYMTIYVQYPDRPSSERGAIINSYADYNDDWNCAVPSTYSNTIKYLEDNGISTVCDFSSLRAHFADPLDYIGTYGSPSYEIYYPNFAESGSEDDLVELVKAIAPSIEFTALADTDYKGDYADWESKYGQKFDEELVNISRELYARYSKDPSYSDNTYTNSYIQERGRGGSYYALADKIIEELVKYGPGLVNDIADSAVETADQAA